MQQEIVFNHSTCSQFAVFVDYAYKIHITPGAPSLDTALNIYYSIVDGSNELLTTGLLELSSTCHTHIELLMSEMHSYSHL